MAPPDDDRIEQRLRQLFSAHRKEEADAEPRDTAVQDSSGVTASSDTRKQKAPCSSVESELRPSLEDTTSGLPALTVTYVEEESEERHDAALAVVHFLLGEMHCAVPLAEVREVQMVPSLTRVPNTAAHVIGLMNLRGNVVSVADIRRRLAIEPKPPGQTARVLIFESDGELIGVLADAVLGPVRLPLPLMDPPVGSSTELLAGVVELEGTPVTVLRTAGLTQWDERKT